MTDEGGATAMDITDPCSIFRIFAPKELSILSAIKKVIICFLKLPAHCLSDSIPGYLPKIFPEYFLGRIWLWYMQVQGGKN